MMYVGALQYRTAKLLHTAALRLRKHTPRLGAFGAWNRCLNHLLTLAESHIESVILQHFITAVDRWGCQLLMWTLHGRGSACPLCQDAPSCCEGVGGWHGEQRHRAPVNLFFPLCILALKAVSCTAGMSWLRSM